MSRWWMLKQYLNHRLASKGNRHIHSPFIFDWYNQVLRTSGGPDDILEIERIRQALLQDTSEISITDLGAGSRTGQAATRTVAQIAKSALKPSRQAKLLYRIANAAGANHIVEFGTSLGITAAYLSATPNTNLTSIEGDPAIHDLAANTIVSLGRNNVHLVNSSFDDWLQNGISDDVDMVFFDGNHSYEATMRYWVYFKDLPGLKVAVWDDIYWSQGMKKAWNEITEGLNQGVAIDLFHLGIVYPNRAQAKELFTFRIP